MANITNQAEVTLTNAGISAPSGTMALDILNDGVYTPNNGVIYNTAEYLTLKFIYLIPQKISNIDIFSFDYDGNGVKYKLFADDVLIADITGGESWNTAWSGIATTLTILSTMPITEIEIYGDSIPCNFSIDTVRKTSDAIMINVDTYREVTDGSIPVMVTADTLRKTYSTVMINADTKRIMASGLRYKSLNIAISSKTLTDKITTVTCDNVDINQFFTINIKGFSYTFKVSEISEPDFNLDLQNKFSTVTGVYDIDSILDTEIILNIPNPSGYIVSSSSNGSVSYTSYPSAIQIITALAKTLGKTANIKMHDFAPQETGYRSTGKDIISSVFGWMDKIPQKLINVFIRGNAINVIQRGEESGVIPLIKFANVTRNRKQIKTLQSGVDSDGKSISKTAISGTPTPANNNEGSYLSGTFNNGDTSITYSNGLVKRESHIVNGVSEVTTYNYSSSIPPAYLNEKNTITADGRINITYSYDDEKLTKEVEKHYTGSELDMTRITRHYPLGQGMWGTSIEEDGITTYGGISQGAPGGKASPYSIKTGSKNQTSGSSVPPVINIEGRPYSKYLGTVPVYGEVSLQYVVDAVIWLDRKIETRVSLESYDETIFDFTNRILWNGDEYYLESNNISQDPDKIVQKIEMVRWG